MGRIALFIVVCFEIANQRQKPHQQHNITGNPESSMDFMISCLKSSSQASFIKHLVTSSIT